MFSSMPCILLSSWPLLINANICPKLNCTCSLVWVRNLISHAKGKHKLRVVWHIVLRTTFELSCKGNGLTVGLRAVVLTLYQQYSVDKIKKNEMGGLCSTNWDENSLKFLLVCLKGRHYLEFVDVNGAIILKCWSFYIGFIWLRIRTVCFYKGREISRLANQVLTSQEGLYSLDLIMQSSEA